VRVHHRTEHADAILEGGFRDGTYLLPPPVGELRGVFVSADWPVDDNEGAHGEIVLEVDIPDDLWREHEWVEEDGTWRQAMISAGELNRFPVRVLSEAEVDALTAARWESFRTN